MKKNYLLTPGPTPLPPQIMRILGRPIIHHRTPQFRAILKQVEEGLKYASAVREIMARPEYRREDPHEQAGDD